MAHGITRTDSFIANGKANGKVGDKAWHGLGIYVEGVKSGDELLRIAGLDWDVESLPLFAVANDDAMIAARTHVLNVRSDNRQALGVVGSSYKPFHNRQMIELVNAMADGDAEIETIGSIHGGRRTWALVRGSSFSVRDGDTTQSYLACCNSHDGTLAINLFWTSVRIVCNNTFRAALGAKGERNSISIRHEGSVMTKVEQAKVALGLLEATTEREAMIARTLDGYQMTRESLQRFYIDVYSRLEGAIPSNPQDATEKRRVEKATEAIATWGRLFDQDRRRTNGAASMWTAFNSITEWYDHHKLPAVKDAAAREDARLYGNLFGSNCDRKSELRELALAAI